MQTQRFCLKFYAANIIYSYIQTNNVQNFDFLQQKNGHKITPPPRPYGTGINMQ